MNAIDGGVVNSVVLTLDGLNATTEQIAATGSLYVPLTGGTMTGSLTMSGFTINNVGTGAVGSAQAVNVAQMTAADTVVTNAYIAADALKLSLSGGTISGSILSTGISQPFNFANSAGVVTARLSAGTTAVTNACSIQLCSNSQSILDFQGNANTTKAQIKYLYGTPGTLNMLVNGVTALSTTDTTCTFGVPLAMSTKKITGLLTGAAASTDAANVLQMEAADLVVTNAYIAADALKVNTSTLASYSTTTQAATATTTALAPYSTTTAAATATTAALAPYSTTTQMNTALGLKVNTTTLASYSTTAQAATATTAALANYSTTTQMNIADGMVQAGYIAADVLKVTKNGDTMTGTLTMSGSKILQVGNATLDGDAVNRLQVASGSIPRTAWASGETIKRKFFHMGNYTLAPASFGPNAANYICTTSFSVTAGNTLICTYSGGISSGGDNHDVVSITFEMFNEATSANSTTVNCPWYLAYNGNRQRFMNVRAIFVPTVTLNRTVRVNFHNGSQEDTVTLTNTNWAFTIEEIQA